MLDLDDKNVKALYRRGQAKMNMQDFDQAMVPTLSSVFLGFWHLIQTIEMNTLFFVAV